MFHKERNLLNDKGNINKSFKTKVKEIFDTIKGTLDSNFIISLVRGITVITVFTPHDKVFGCARIKLFDPPSKEKRFLFKINNYFI